MVDPNQVIMTDYAGGTFRRHQQDILGQVGYTAFDKEASAMVSMEMKRMVSLRTEPGLIMEAVVTFLEEHRIELPGYATLRTLLEKSFRHFEQDLEEILGKYLNLEDRDLLDSLLVLHDSYQQEEKSQIKIKRYQLTFFDNG